MSPRDDFFTLIHKGLRRELFAATTLAGTTDWEDPGAVGRFAATWSDLHHLLEIHAAHEDHHFFPLIAGAEPDLLARLDVGHHQQEQALAEVAGVVVAALAAPTPAAGLDVHRRLSAFVAGYLLHMLDEESDVMPAIWRHCTDEDLRRARAAFLAGMAPEDAALSRRVMLPALSPPERAAMLGLLRAIAPEAVFSAVVDDARQVLSDADWRRLADDLGAAPQPTA